ncbi:MAG: SPASM domain-containing protein [Bacillota bacterium]
MGFFSNLFGSKTPKKNRIIDEIQLEACYYPPFGEGSFSLMEWSTFLKAAEHFENVKRINFSGWGNPFHHPQFAEMLKKARENCSLVTISCKAQKFSPETARMLVDLGIEQITLTLDPADKDFNYVGDYVESIIKIRKDTPKIVIDFPMTTTSISCLPQFIGMAKQFQIDEITASNVKFLLTEELNQQKVFSGKVSDENRGDLLKQGKAKGPEEYEILVAEAEKNANRHGIYFSAKPLVANESVMCEMSPLKNCYINWKGELAPCQLLSLEKGSIYFNESQYELVPYQVGNVNSLGIPELWNDEKYGSFRNIYKRRVDIFNKYMAETFEDEPNAKLIYNNYEKLEKQLAEEKVPPMCSICYKAYSI